MDRFKKAAILWANIGHFLVSLTCVVPAAVIWFLLSILYLFALPEPSKWWYDEVLSWLVWE